jgi:pyruvate,water dikinase
MDRSKEFILWFDQLGIEDVPYTGGKNASLGEMYQNLTAKGVQVPNGFAVTAYAYEFLVEKTNIKQKIRDVLADLDTTDMKNLALRGDKVRHLFLNAEFPDELKEKIVEAYVNMCKQYGDNCDVAVRSSATAEDLPDASFAGQQETFLNIRGPEMLLDACRKCFASLFTNRAISYRVDKGFDHFKVALSIGVQKMVRSDLACSGVMFSIDTETGFKDAVFITSAYGLGENVVQGAVNPDEFYVFKPTLKSGFKPVIHKEVGEKAIKMIYSQNGIKQTKNIPVTKEEQRRFSISDDEVLTLAKWSCIIEDHYSEKAGHFKPMDMEWAKDGETGGLFIVQARPETVQSQKDITSMEEYKLKKKGTVLIQGKSVGSKIGAGEVNVIKDVSRIDEFEKGQVLVTDMTDPDWEPIMKIAAAIVTNRGGRTCHAAIISRELGIPCVVGTQTATESVENKQKVTVDCSEGDEGYVYDGLLPYDVNKTDLKTIPETKTKIMMNLANPEESFALSFLPNKGVGLAREEFIINSFIKIHPLALLHFDELKDAKTKKQIEQLTSAYDDKVSFYVEKLAQGIARLSAAFYPKDVILRFSDFKSNEYANLIGGKEFEPVEDNPMIGWRGASRYYSEKFAEAFGLECKAVLKVRNEMGLTNLKVMIPFCRTIDEGKKVLAEMAKHGLKQGEHGLEVICMCEIPANVVLADEFLDVFDGFSIGSNDLTQLTLGLDRDSELVADIYDERNAAVKSLIKKVIEVANKKGKYIGICGQAPSDYPEMAEFVVESGIHSMSLNPDTVVKTTLAIAELEKKLGKK